MPAKINLMNQKFGKLTVIAPAPNKKNRKNCMGLPM